jgi:hypothetical protein
MDEDRSPPDGAPPDVDGAEVLRPEATVLRDESLVPDTNFVDPPPNRFTHELVADEPYRLDRDTPGAEPDGVLRAGTPVIVLVEGSDRSRVVDDSGLYVEVSNANLRKLPGAN